jgi:hypothetical protein
MDKVLYLIACSGVPVRPGLIGLEPGKCFAEGDLQLARDKDVRLSDTEARVERRGYARTPKMLSFVA